MHIIRKEDKATTIVPINNNYCSKLIVVDEEDITITGNCTAFGYVLDKPITINGCSYDEGAFFSLPVTGERDFYVPGRVVLFIREGFIGQTIMGLLEKEGRVQYIDGCTDSVLVGPPRKGDACLNSLHFPKNTEQTLHTHPSVRLGVVAHGSGKATIKGRDISLNQGDAFCIEANEPHRFITKDSNMIVVAYHPDSDWGPTDEVHPMKNRTYL